MARETKNPSPQRRYDPRDSYTVGEHVDFGPLGAGIVTDVLSWAAPPTPDRHSLVVTLDDGHLVYFAAGMGEDAPAVDMTTVPAALPASEVPADAGPEPWRAALAQSIGQEVPIPGSRKRLRVKTLSGDGVLVIAGRGPETLLPWRGLEASRRHLQEHGQLPLSDLETLSPDVDVNLMAALLALIPGAVLKGKPPIFYLPHAWERDEAAGFIIPLRPVHLSKSFVSLPTTAWSVLPLPPLGEHVYIPVLIGDAITLCRLSHRDSPQEARLYLRGEAGRWLREQCQEDDALRFWPLRNDRGEFVALAVDRAAGDA